MSLLKEVERRIQESDKEQQRNFAEAESWYNECRAKVYAMLQKLLSRYTRDLQLLSRNFEGYYSLPNVEVELSELTKGNYKVILRTELDHQIKDSYPDGLIKDLVLSKLCVDIKANETLIKIYPLAHKDVSNIETRLLNTLANATLFINEALKQDKLKSLNLQKAEELNSTVSEIEKELLTASTETVKHVNNYYNKQQQLIEETYKYCKQQLQVNLWTVKLKGEFHSLWSKSNLRQDGIQAIEKINSGNWLYVPIEAVDSIETVTFYRTEDSPYYLGLPKELQEVKKLSYPKTLYRTKQVVYNGNFVNSELQKVLCKVVHSYDSQYLEDGYYYSTEPIETGHHEWEVYQAQTIEVVVPIAKLCVKAEQP